MKSGKFSFPKIEKVKINGFSLYKKDGVKNNIKENINSGVFCLAGANGLGKTTFLNILNYGLTGIVLEPDKSTSTPTDIISSNKRYTERYFQGRVHSEDYSSAKVVLHISLNKLVVKISRSFFDRSSLYFLEVTDENNTIDYSEFDGKEKLKIYQDIIAEEVGIGTFENFIFYQLYVLTFDENRRTIFWDDNVSTETLSLAFNDDLDDAARALQLKEEMSALESYGRNTRWQATQLKKEKENLIAIQKQQELTNYNELKREYDRLLEEIAKSEKIFTNTEVEYDTLLKRQNLINSEILHQKTSYKQLFSLYSEPRSKITNNKYIKYSIESNECFVCGAEGNNVSESIQKKVYQHSCPLCDTNINENQSEEQIGLFNKLQEIDKEINRKNDALTKLILDTEAKGVALEKAENELEFQKVQLNNFEEGNKNLNFEVTGDEPIDKLIRDYNERYKELDKKAKSFYRKRDKLRPEYDFLMDKVSNSYNNAVAYFVPLFKDIAKSFIGLDLNISLNRSSRATTLTFELLGSARTESTQLSESQRFFLDIALRMALVIYLSEGNNSATLFIDTPEGSLDIAYENRVGKMFAKFVKEYHQNIVMTANINASQLLVSLAEECGSKNMKFRRMLDWTDLSAIQMEGEHLFNGPLQI